MEKMAICIYKPVCAKKRQGVGVTLYQGCVLMELHNILTVIKVWAIEINIYIYAVS